jgi:hypothetical protein
VTPPTSLLGDVAHARAGDKGDTSILMVAPFDPEDFEPLMTALSTRAVGEHFGAAPNQVEIIPSPHLRAITIVVRERLTGGVTRSPTIDPHGKALSAHLLDLQINWPQK